mgnify:CR=1 FL=1
MPVYVESVTQPSPQDLTDLAKIYADAPDWLLAPYSSADTLIAAALADGSLHGHEALVRHAQRAGHRDHRA